MSNKENRVEILLPKAFSGEDPNLFISVNGINYLLPKGKSSLVPPEVKQEWERAYRAEGTLDARIHSMKV